jgi:hypothetical protein
MELILLKEGCAELEWLWNWLAVHPINEGIADPCLATNEGQSWQYLGTFRHNGKVVHELRHRKHQKTNTKVDLKVSASPLFNEESILPKH